MRRMLANVAFRTSIGPGACRCRPAPAGQRPYRKALEAKPTITYQQLWSADGGYSAGDAVTFDGSLFIAQQDTTDRPETSPAWGLAVKRGRDAREKK